MVIIATNMDNSFTTGSLNFNNISFCSDNNKFVNMRRLVCDKKNDKSGVCSIIYHYLTVFNDANI